jgi:hypothetical protein
MTTLTLSLTLAFSAYAADTPKPEPLKVEDPTETIEYLTARLAAANLYAKALEQQVAMLQTGLRLDVANVTVSAKQQEIEQKRGCTLNQDTGKCQPKPSQPSTPATAPPALPTPPPATK